MNSRERRAIAAAEHNEKRRQHLEAVRYHKWLETHTQGQRREPRVQAFIDGRAMGLTRLQSLLLASTGLVGITF